MGNGKWNECDCLQRMFTLPTCVDPHEEQQRHSQELATIQYARIDQEKMTPQVSSYLSGYIRLKLYALRAELVRLLLNGLFLGFLVSTL